MGIFFIIVPTATNSVFAVRTKGAHQNASLRLGTSQTRRTLSAIFGD